MGNERRTVQTIYQNENKTNPETARFGRNLNLSYLAGRLEPCCHREEVLQTVQKTMLRKNKTNILLTGAAGCGKTAIAEGLAAIITEKKLQYLRDCDLAQRQYQKAMQDWEAAGKVGKSPEYTAPYQPPLCDCVIYEVSLNSMVSGTKYRGDFEGRIQAVIEESQRNPNIILFIDEFHSVLTCGATEGSPGAGQILKPALARGDIRVIAATTTDEKEAILQDKALTRRFTQVEVPELRDDAALDTARSLLKHYCAYHKVSTDVTADELLSQISYHLPESVFPDNFINVVDETLAGAVFEEITKVNREHFIKTLSRMSGHLIFDLDTYLAS